jgi:hypothetical protein
MFARNIPHRNAQIAILAPANDGHVPYDRKASTLAVVAKHYQHYLHKVTSDLNSQSN